MSYVLIVDTCSLMENPMFFSCYREFPDYKVIIPRPVLDELDGLKHNEGEAGYKARNASRVLDLVFDQYISSLAWELVLDETTEKEMLEKVPDYRSASRYHNFSNDDRILAITEYLQEKHKEDTVLLATLDRNMKIRAKARNVNVLDPTNSVTISEHVWVLSMAIQGFLKQPGQFSGYTLNFDMGDGRIGEIRIAPYWVTVNREVSTVNIGLHEPDENGAIKDIPSAVMVLSTEDRIRYRPEMDRNKIPYMIFKANTDTGTFIEGNNIRVDIGVYYSEIFETRSRQLADQKQNATAAMMQGMGNSRYMFVDGLITLISATREENKMMPAFSQLSLRLQASAV